MSEPPSASQEMSHGMGLTELAREMAELRAMFGPADSVADTDTELPSAERIVAVVGQAHRGRTTVAGHLASLTTAETTSADPAVRVLDAPAWNAPGAMPDADLVVVVITAGSPVGLEERHLLEAVAATTAGAPTVVAVTRLDTVDEEERPEVLDHIERRVQQCLGGARVIPAGRDVEDASALREEVNAVLRGVTDEARSRRRLRVLLTADLAVLGERCARAATVQDETRRLRAAREAESEKEVLDGEGAWTRILDDLRHRCAQETAAARASAATARDRIYDELVHLHRRSATDAEVQRALREFRGRATASVDQAAARDQAGLEGKVRQRFGLELERKSEPPPVFSALSAHSSGVGTRSRLPGVSSMVVSFAGAAIIVRKATEGKWTQAVGSACTALTVIALERRTQEREAARVLCERADQLASALEINAAQYTQDVYGSLTAVAERARERWRVARPSTSQAASETEEPDWAGVAERIVALRVRLTELVAHEYTRQEGMC